MNQMYELLTNVQASIENKKPIYIGKKNVCRYCGATDKSKFRKKAHTFPEALGNKWVFSLDECDSCNQKFSLYEDALVKFAWPFLTFGGVSGKKGATRQIGRTNGPSRIKHTQNPDGSRRFSYQEFVDNLSDHIYFDPHNPIIQTASSLPLSPFKPRYAYKALAKMGFALLPASEIDKYQKLREWLLNVDDDIEYRVLCASFSSDSIGISPAIIYSNLLRRINPTDQIPYIILVLCTGSICWQIAMASDYMDDHLCPESTAVRIKQKIIIPEKLTKNSLTIEYGEPVAMNWASCELKPSPFKTSISSINYGSAPPVKKIGIIYEDETTKRIFYK